ncbi:hypothetical protein MRX96_059118 [Rhipicephalus microplus]
MLSSGNSVNLTAILMTGLFRDTNCSPLRAPLLSMEHCIAPFLNGCDKNDDHTITLKEWGECLGLEDGEIQDRCAQITA